MAVEHVRSTLRERIAHGATLHELEHLLRRTRGLTEVQRNALWNEVWRYDPRRVTLKRMEAVRDLFHQLATSRSGSAHT